MHILLTDVLACPRCGPEFGLVVLADSMGERNVLEGTLGCMNCREVFPIRSGVADLRLTRSRPPLPRGSEPAGGAEDSEAAAYRVAALLGVADRPATVLLIGAHPEVAARVAGLLPQALVSATDPPGAPASDSAPLLAVDWLRHGSTLPFRSRALAAVALLEGAEIEVAEAARVVSGGGRLVLDPAPAGAAGTLREEGLAILLEQEGVVVASVQPPR